MLILIFVLIFPLGKVFAVEDNIKIDGNLSPPTYSQQLYIVKVSPTPDQREVKLSIYGPSGKLSDQSAFILENSDHVNFFVKFFPPLFQVGEKYTIEVTGSGLIGRATLTMMDQEGSIPTLPPVETINTDSPSIEMSANSPSLNEGDKFVITGTVKQFDQSRPYLGMNVTSPSGHMFSIYQIGRAHV